MRMWMIPPIFLCNKHLLGQHAELHMLSNCIEKNKSLKGYIKKKVIEPKSIVKYHNMVVSEMKFRGFIHKTPLTKVQTDIDCVVDKYESLNELSKRCFYCRKKISP